MILGGAARREGWEAVRVWSGGWRTARLVKSRDLGCCTRVVQPGDPRGPGGALWGLLDKDDRSPAKRLVWGCPAASRPQPLTAPLRPGHTSPAAVTTLS